MNTTFFLVTLLVTFTVSVNAQNVQVSCVPSLSGSQPWSSLYGSGSSQNSVTISSGNTVVLDVSELKVNGGITIEAGATLYFDWQKSFNVTVGYISVKGSLFIGTEDCPFENKVAITLTADSSDLTYDVAINDRTINMNAGRKVIAVAPDGVMELHGAKGISDGLSWTKISQTAEKGTNVLHLVNDVADNGNPTKKWSVGDRLVLAGTDFDPAQSEEVFIKSVTDSKTIELTANLAFTHFGEITYGFDERAEVGLLSRNIFIQGAYDPKNATNGGHIISLSGHKLVKIEGVELYNMGQDEIGRYPIHFHMNGPVNGDYARFNSIRNSNFRCITIHATNNLLVQGNVAYDHLGHCIFFEDGVEEDNKIYNNLVIRTKSKNDGQRVGSDGGSGVSSYWITNPKNEFVGNVAVGCDNSGFWIDTKNGPRGTSLQSGRYNNINPSNRPLTVFNDNLAHSCVVGLQIEATNFDAWDNPQVPAAPNANWAPYVNGVAVATLISNFSTYKSRDRGIWARLADIHLQGGFHADNMVGLEVGTGGSHPPSPSLQIIEDLTFIGFTGNHGNEVTNGIQYWDSVTGTSFARVAGGMMGWRTYDGSQGIRNCTFINYPKFDGDSKVHHAIGVRNPNNNQVSTRNFVETSKFVNVFTKFYIADLSGDGGKTTNLRDDGSISGHRGSFALPPQGYYTAPSCQTDSSFGLSCPHKYVQMWVMDMSSSKGQNPVTLTRNQHTGTDHSKYSLTLSGFADYGLYRYQPIVSSGASYLVSFKNYVTPKLAFELINGDAEDAVELVVCYPGGTTINKVYRGYGNMNGYGGLPSKSSASEITAGTETDGYSYTWDSSRNLLFVTLKQRANSTDYKNFCPTKGCDFVWIEANVGSGAYDCMGAAYSGANSVQIQSGDWLNTPFASTARSVPLSTGASAVKETSAETDHTNTILIASLTGGFVVIALVAVTLFFIYKRRSRNQTESAEISL